MKVAARFLLEEDGLTFHLKAVFTDSLHTTISDEHSSTFPEITRICGPVQKVNDTTFTVRFYRMGMYNKRRTGDICCWRVMTVIINIKVQYRNLVSGFLTVTRRGNDSIYFFQALGM